MMCRLWHGMVNGLLALMLLGVSAPIGAQPEVIGLAASGVYTEDFSTYTAKDYTEDALWDMWTRSLQIALSDGKEQYTPAIAVDSKRYGFVVWEDNHNIYAQYLDTNGNRVWQKDLQVSAQVSLGCRNPSIAITPNDTAVIAWGDERNGDYDIYAQMIDSNGNRLWIYDVQVSSDAGTEHQWNPVVKADNIGNAFVTWESGGVYIQKLDVSGNKIWQGAVLVVDYGDEPYLTVDKWGNAVVVWWDIGQKSIFAQRISSNGNKLWADNVKVSELYSTVWPKEPSVAVDNNGNAFVVWNDDGIYVQQLSTSGNRVWGSNVRVDSNTSSCWNPAVTVDMSNQAIITGDNWNSIYAHKIDQDGNKSWPNSVRVQRNQHATDRGSSSVAVDGQGQILITWWERGNSDIYIQKLDLNGLHLWEADVRTNAGSGTAIQRGNVVVTAQDNTSFVVWHDSRNGKADIYVQRVSLDGISLWESDIRVNGVIGMVHEEARYTAFGADLDINGNLIVVWGDSRDDDGDIYAQQIDVNGNRRWIADIRVNSDVTVASQSGPDVATDEMGNTVIVWSDYRNGNSDIYAQKIDSSGSKLWVSDVYIHDVSDASQYFPDVAVDDAGNAIVAWNDRRNKPYNNDIYAQRLSFNGTRLWVSDIKINGDSDASEPVIVIDPSGNAVLAWQDYTNSYELYAQKLSSTGSKLWGTGVVVTSQREYAECPSAAIDGEGNTYIVWWGNRDGNDIYAQRLSPDGIKLWANDLRVNSNLDSTVYASRASIGIDNQDTVLVAWADDRNKNDDIYLQKLTEDAEKMWVNDIQLISPDFFYFPSGTAQSREVDTTDAPITEATLTAQYILQGGDVDFFLTNDGGAHWAAVQPGVTHVFTTAGSDLRWRVEMTSDPVWRHRSPIIDSLRIEYATTSADGDDYESDDACNQAQPIQIGGVAQTHNFHQYQDNDWVWFDAQAGTTYLIQTTNTGDRADTVLELYNQCGQPPDATDDNAFGPGATLSFEAPTSGTYYVRVLQHDGTVYGADTEYDLSVRAQQPSQGAVIIVAGRRQENDYRQPIINATANLAYQTFRGAGFSDADIYYLNSDVGQPGVDAVPTESNVRDVIQDWARTRVGLGTPLWLYLADHGQVDRFHNEVDEVVTAGELNLWLSNLEATSGVDQINVIIDACHSGSFIDTQEQGGYGLEEISGHGRVVVASTPYSSQAYAPGGSNSLMYFSSGFWRALGGGQNLWHAFLAGRSEVESGGVGQCGDYAFNFFCQRPWLDDTGDAWFDGADGQLAQTRGLAASFGGGAAPYIDWVQAGEVTEGQATIEAQVRDDESVTRVWMRVFAPSFAPPAGVDGSIPVIEVPEAELSAASGDMFVLDYAGFTEEGAYQVVVYAMDDEGNVSVPRSVLVGGQKVYLPLILRGRP